MNKPQRDITLRFLAEPQDVNFGGKVHGGAVMKWIDLAAYACSAGWSGRYCVTAYAGGIRFIAPIHVGSLVEVEAKVIYTGNSSMHIALEVNACDPKFLNRTLTTHCIVIMVAVDENGKSEKIPTWIPESPEDIKQHESAIKLMEMRKLIGEEMQIFVE
ncbi:MULTISPECIES: acyl-CoA thioesterase [unclassified Colwellia]|jgi:acyl-CoA hydrolase|uniref:acyl-CoA thioesterase n=1 Tax=unclassified Colwellia TaxID=196834 RepID=UPI0015F3C055|nr:MULTISPECIES: acyl-CoA thioesterase [unclassified Colwellia]MBA6234503.1 acyl-CoA thioesterase [Colwellia sp. MB02u-7]MBA6236924.1 acyl-CoA thioesterase [Colwellia sp. MB02u-11]MBA6256133.1 acyl-CoA thioesterase [Colwellia sp. MB3u-28]MBA6260017.1 acyl-CoA thioesterase [Colwellia sp. MB3u-41]MBA6263844.1 acyl-CoA thioesterase [Colwellia sp. Bg11-12]